MVSCAVFVMHENNANPSSVVILDPTADTELAPSDTADGITYFVFGGILGTHPMDGRTGREVTARFPPEVGQRHLGVLQMTTDTAVIVTLRVLVGMEPLTSLPYVDNPKFRISGCETLKMKGFRYLVGGGTAVLPPGMMEMWREDDTIA